MDALGVPGGSLFAALAVGIAYALTLARGAPLEPPVWAVKWAQVVIGVALGAQLDASTLSTLAADWASIALVTVGTLAISVTAGWALSAVTDMDRPTTLLGLIAGGASGIVAMSDEFGADARLVAFMQYLRVLMVVVAAPLAAHLLGDGGAAPEATDVSHGEGLAVDLAFTAGCGVVGFVVAQRVRITAGTLLVPFAIAAGLAIGGVGGDAQVPELIQHVAFAAVGLQVGLRFTAATIRQARGVLPAVLAAILAMIGSCAALGAILVPLADVSFATAYLATTPGGLYAVVAVAVGAGGNAAFVLAVQVLRLFVMILAVPLLVRLLHRERTERPG